MDNSNVFVGLDIGSTSIKVVICEKANDQMSVIGVGNVPSQGVSRGVIVDIDKAANAIKKAVNQAEEKASVKANSVIVGIPADNIRIEPVNGMINIADSNSEIADADVIDVARACIANELAPEREVIDLTPDEFTVDDLDGVQDPRGMMGSRLSMKGRMITGPKTIIHNIKKAVSDAGFNIEALVVDPQAEGKSILSSPEQDFGTILVDIGGGQTTVAVIHDNELKYANVDPEGGQYITKDISSVLSTSITNAEKLKRGYGFADVSQASDDNEFPVEVVGQNRPITVSEKLLAEIIQARIDQIFARIRKDLDEAGALNLPGGIVITGGVASMPGIASLAANTFGVNVRVYIPDQIGLRHPSLSLALALVNYGGNLSSVEKLVRAPLGADNYLSNESNSVYTQQQASPFNPKAAKAGKWKREREEKKAKKEAEKKKNSRSVSERVTDWFHNYFE